MPHVRGSRVQGYLAHKKVPPRPQDRQSLTHYTGVGFDSSGSFHKRVSMAARASGGGTVLPQETRRLWRGKRRLRMEGKGTLDQGLMCSRVTRTFT